MNLIDTIEYYIETEQSDLEQLIDVDLNNEYLDREYILDCILDGEDRLAGLIDLLKAQVMPADKLASKLSDIRDWLEVYSEIKPDLNELAKPASKPAKCASKHRSNTLTGDYHAS